MAIAKTLKAYLTARGVPYELVSHPRSSTTLEAAHAAHVPGDQVAKAVVLEDADGYVVAVVPSTNRLDFDWVGETLGRGLQLAEEYELPELFRDCSIGAVPGLPEAYGLEVVWDDQLDGQDDIYVEAGDHRNLIHIRGEDFEELMAGLPHDVISAEKEYSGLDGR